MNKEDEYNAIFDPIQKERILFNLTKAMTQAGMNYNQICQDSALQEIIALAIEAQVGQKVNRASIRALLPSPTVMAQKLPAMKKAIDGE